MHCDAGKKAGNRLDTLQYSSDLMTKSLVGYANLKKGMPKRPILWPTVCAGMAEWTAKEPKFNPGDQVDVNLFEGVTYVDVTVPVR
jgi:hypothetical protein